MSSELEWLGNTEIKKVTVLRLLPADSLYREKLVWTLNESFCFQGVRPRCCFFSFFFLFFLDNDWRTGVGPCQPQRVSSWSSSRLDASRSVSRVKRKTCNVLPIQSGGTEEDRSELPRTRPCSTPCSVDAACEPAREERKRERERERVNVFGRDKKTDLDKCWYNKETNFFAKEMRNEGETDLESRRNLSWSWRLNIWPSIRVTTHTNKHTSFKLFVSRSNVKKLPCSNDRSVKKYCIFFPQFVVEGSDTVLHCWDELRSKPCHLMSVSELNKAAFRPHGRRGDLHTDSRKRLQHTHGRIST